MNLFKTLDEKNRKIFFWFGMLFLISLTSFSLGYFISLKFNRTPIVIEQLQERGNNQTP